MDNCSKIGCRLNNAARENSILQSALNSLALVAQPPKWKLFQNYFTLHKNSRNPFKLKSMLLSARTIFSRYPEFIYMSKK